MQKINYSLLTVKPLTKHTDVSSFQCSEKELTDYLKENALIDKQHLYSVTKVIEYEGKIIGFFSLITDSIDINKVDSEIVQKYAYKKLPAIKIARLATDEKYVGSGVGGFMLRHIFLIVLNLIEDVGSRVITVDAKSEAQGFYEHFTFKSVNSKKKQEFIPMYLDIGTLYNSLQE